MHRKELVKLSRSPPLQFTFNKKKTKSFKVKLVYRKSLQSIILLDFWERTEQKLRSFDWEKRPKAEGKMSPKILLEKNKERENRVSEEEKGREEKKAITALLVFLPLFESPILAVTLFKNLALIYISFTLVPNTNLI